MLCLFYSCPPLFRAWTGAGQAKAAGASGTDTGRVLTGNVDLAACSLVWGASGVFYKPDYNNDGAYAQTGSEAAQPTEFYFDSSNVWREHAGTEFAPIHIHIPVVLYLGNSV